MFSAEGLVVIGQQLPYDLPKPVSLPIKPEPKRVKIFLETLPQNGLISSYGVQDAQSDPGDVYGAGRLDDK